LPDALGQTDPTAGTEVVISAGDGKDTITDQNGNFVIGDLPAGSYTVTLIDATIPTDFHVIGSKTVTVQVVPDDAPPVVDFQIAPIQKIDFSNSSAAKQQVTPR
jgi:hypothetical protein